MAGAGQPEIPGFVRAIPEVEGHSNQAGTKTGKIRDERLGAVRQPERNAIAVAASTADEVGGEMIGRSHECEIRESPASAEDGASVRRDLKRHIHDLIEQHDVDRS
jgi:hypothetical protein